MAAPTNTAITTATDIPTLPASISQNVHDAGTTYSVWYKVTPAADGNLSVFGFGDLVTYQPKITVKLGPTGAPTTYLGLSLIGPNLPIQIPVTAGTTYYFQFVTNAGNPNPAVLLLTVEAFAEVPAPSGSIAINDDTEGFPLVIRSATTGDVVKFVNGFTSGEAGDILDNGVSCWHSQADTNLVLYDAQFTEIATIPSVDLNSLFGTLRTCLGTQRFWFCYFSGGQRNARYVTEDGTLGTAHVLTGIGDVNAIAVANDETILYSANSASGDPVKRWDLLTDTAAANLAAGIAPYFISDILVLSDDTIVVMYSRSAFGVFDAQALRYSAAGATLNTYAFGSDQDYPGGTLPRLAYATDSLSFWVWTHPASTPGKSLFQQVRVSDGTVLTSLAEQEYETGVYNSAATATPSARFGNSFSCPFVILRSSSSPQPPDADLNGPGGLAILRSRGRLIDSPIRRVRRAPILFNENKRIQLQRFELFCTTGSATVTGQGSAPVVLFNLSKDSGQTWFLHKTLNTGALGEYLYRCYTHQLGMGRQFVVEVVQTDPVETVWTDAAILPEEGLN